MLKLSVLIILFANAWANTAPARLRSLEAHDQVLLEDLARISTSLTATFKASKDSSARVSCQGNKTTLHVQYLPGEKAATLYQGLRHLGFLFPHPRWQITPKNWQKSCGRTFAWDPVIKYRGFHLHTLHPNEWVQGFFMGRPEIAIEYVRWLARNGQNLMDVSLLRVPLTDISSKFKAPFQLAKDLGIHTGVSLGVALQQQRSYKLLNLWQALTGLWAEDCLKDELKNILNAVDVSFVVLEAGTSEFTPTNYVRTLNWLNLAADICSERGKQLFTKVHVSTNQHDSKWGNYNFLPRHAQNNVGILPHTVMFYGLEDAKAPMYGNKDFSAIRDFTEEEKALRPTWYYPETGYWVAMDVDIPLLLTDYLQTRAQDLKWSVGEGIEGHLNFTTGMALGGWLFDWNLTLLTDRQSNFDPLIGLKFLGEDPKQWQRMLDYQAVHFKDRGVISMLSSANLQDELSSTHRIHKRATFKDLSKDSSLVQREVDLLQKAMLAWPQNLVIKHPALRDLLEVTRLRLSQALVLRKAMLTKEEKETWLKRSAALRTEASALLLPMFNDPLNYGDAGMFIPFENPTSYQYGYVYPAMSLHFWKREELMVEKNSFWPFFMSLYDFRKILF